MIEKRRQHVFVRQAESTQQQSSGHTLAFVEAEPDTVARIEFKLNPRTTRRCNTGRVAVLLTRTGLLCFTDEEGARRTVDLRNNDALGTVDKKAARWGHQRQVGHKHRFFTNLADGVRADFRAKHGSTGSVV